MTRDQLIAVIISELSRQSQDKRHDTPYLYDTDDDNYNWGIDGHVKIDELADAILEML